MDMPQLTNAAVAAGIPTDPAIMEPARRDAGRAGLPRAEHSGARMPDSRRPGWRLFLAAQAPMALQVAAWIGAIGIVLAIKKFG
jgi:hypothetical protein